MEKGTREKFKDVIFLVSNYPIFWQAWRDAEPGKDKEKQSKDLKGYWDDIHSLPQLIMSEVELEPISINEDKDAFGNLEDK